MMKHRCSVLSCRTAHSSSRPRAGQGRWGGGRGACAAPAPADQVGQAACEASRKDGIAGCHVAAAEEALLPTHCLQLGLQDDGDDDAIDCHSLAEDDAVKEEERGGCWKKKEGGCNSSSKD